MGRYKFKVVAAFSIAVFCGKSEGNMGVYARVHFKSKDGLQVTADYCRVSDPRGFILLYHRSHCNRAEYRETAPKLNAHGFSCLAIDQRSGMNVFGEVNETSTLAKKQGLATGYLDARPDTSFLFRTY